jgi:hypothetical protein
MPSDESVLTFFMPKEAVAFKSELKLLDIPRAAK